MNRLFAYLGLGLLLCGGLLGLTGCPAQADLIGPNGERPTRHNLRPDIPANKPDTKPSDALKPAVSEDSGAASKWMLVVPVVAAIIIIVILYTRNRAVRSSKTAEQKPGDHVD